jgi:hypothetical protein
MGCGAGGVVWVVVGAAVPRFAVWVERGLSPHVAGLALCVG